MIWNVVCCKEYTDAVTMSRTFENIREQWRNSRTLKSLNFAHSRILLSPRRFCPKAQLSWYKFGINKRKSLSELSVKLKVSHPKLVLSLYILLFVCHKHISVCLLVVFKYFLIALRPLPFSSFLFFFCVFVFWQYGCQA
jgi:hypothetical protein